MSPIPNLRGTQTDFLVPNANRSISLAASFSAVFLASSRSSPNPLLENVLARCRPKLASSAPELRPDRSVSEEMSIYRESVWPCCSSNFSANSSAVVLSYTHLRAHETRHDLVCRLLLEKKKKT